MDVTTLKTFAQADSPDTTRLQPSDMNALRLKLGDALPGGTAITSYTIGDILYASAAGVLSKLAAVAVGNVLVSGGVGAAPAWSPNPTFAGILTTSVDGIGATSTDGSVLQNATAATAGVPVQQPPRLRLRGNVWNTTTPANNTDDWWLESAPANGATPTGVLKFMYSLNGGAAAALLTLNTAFGGTVTTSGSFVSSGNLTAAAAGLVRWNGRGVMASPADSQINLTNAAASVGFGVDVGVDAVMKIRTRAQTGGAAIDLMEQTAPAASTDSVRLFAKDNGSGKTQLVALFPTGVVQVIATEP